MHCSLFNVSFRGLCCCVDECAEFPSLFFPMQKQKHHSEARSLHFAVFWLFAVLVLRFFCFVKGACQLVVVCGPGSALSDEEVGEKKEMGGCSTKVWAVCKCWPTRIIDLPAFGVAWCVHPFLIAVSAVSGQCFCVQLRGCVEQICFWGVCLALKRGCSKTWQVVVLWYRPHHHE